MKKLLYIFLPLLLVLIIAGAAQAQGPRFRTFANTEVLTNQDTAIYDITSGDFKWAATYAVTVLTDSLTGANAGTVYLEYCDDPTGTYWVRDASSLTIDGAAQQTIRWNGTLTARRIRLYAITPSGSRTTRIRCYASIKPTP
jgi:hypothetical protein